MKEIIRPVKFVDIHTHKCTNCDCLRIVNLFLKEDLIMPEGDYYSVGLHPWHIDELDVAAAISWLKILSSNNRVIAIGETGLDKNLKTDIATQIRIFMEQKAIAEEINKPVIVHCVKAYSEMIGIRKKSNRQVPWIFHGYSSSREIANELIGLNCFISFGQQLFNSNSKVLSFFDMLPLSSIFLETDESQYSIEDVYIRAAELKNISVLELCEAVKNNFINCFGREKND